MAATQRLELKPGLYWVGDPCYAVPDEHWIPLLDDAGYFDESAEGSIDGVRVVAFNTAFGDGTYRGSDGFDYGVDAGLIGLIRVDEMEAAGWPKPSDDSGKVRLFVDSFVVRVDNGVMVFGDLVIDTDGYADSEED